jgi:hypothetical protein
MGYFHHDTQGFARVHNPDNPLGLLFPDDFWKKLLGLVWGRYRGLAFYAPILLLAIPGWVVLLVRRSWDVAAVSMSVVCAVLLVNVLYPEWTGGWSTGPRLLLPLLPFAMLPVAALLAGNSSWSALATAGAVVLAVAGAAEMLLFQGVGGRIPHFISDPLFTVVWPLWSGAPMPPWWVGNRFCRNLSALGMAGWIARLGQEWQWVQFLPLALAQGLAIFGLCRLGFTAGGPAGPNSDLGIDQEQDSRRRQ